MKTFSVATSTLSQSLRYALLRSQSELAKAQTEVQTGQVADTGLALGARSSQAVSFSRDLDRIQGIIDSNGLLGSRLKATQSALQQLSTASQTFMSALTAAATDSGTDSATKTSADSMLGTLGSVLNTSYNGEYLFSGINTDVKPFRGFGEGSPAKTAFDDAFKSYFGFSQMDDKAAGITADQMTAFLDKAETQVTGAGWGKNWSSASDQPITSRITLNETTATSVSANNDGAKKLAFAAAVVSSLYGGKVGPAARQAVAEKALTMVNEATTALNTLQANTGVVQQRVSDASDRLNTQHDLFQKQLGSLVDVDPYEASTRVNDLLTHIETSYALTARIQQLSILNYIS